MKRAIRSMRRKTTRKETLAARLSLLCDQKKEIDKEIALLKKEVVDTFGEKERVGRIVHNITQTKVVTEEMLDKLDEDGVLEDVLAPERVDMKKLNALIKSCPEYEKYLRYTTRSRVDVKKA